MSMPFGKYKNFKDCVAQNQDKENPEAYCAQIHFNITGKWTGESSTTTSSKSITPEIVQTFKNIHNKLIDLARQKYSDRATVYVIKNEMKEDYDNLVEWVGSEEKAVEYINKARGDKLAGWVQQMYNSKEKKEAEKKEVKSLGIFATYNELERYVKANKISKYRITAMSSSQDGPYELAVSTGVEAAKGEKEEETYKIWNCRFKPTSCEWCKKLHGQKVKAGELFKVTYNGKTMETFRNPLHPNCVCFIEYV